MSEWRLILEDEPPAGVEVMTKIDDRDGCRNVQSLRWDGRLWWFPDGSMYAYYVPTHWKPLMA